VRFLLDAKAWQLFLVLIGAAFGVHAVPLFGLSTVLVMACWFAWLWAIASEANRRLDLSLRKSTRWMGIGLAYAWVYICAALMLLPFLDDAADTIPGWIVPLHLLGMLGIFYAMAFAAKRLVTLERRQPVTFFDYSGPFFLFWFFPIGVWFIQPRVNKLLGT